MARRPVSRQIGVRVEMAPTGSVAQMMRGESLTWVDVSGYVRLDAGIDLSRGVSGDGFSPDTGTLTLTVANDDGAWTPGQATHAVFGVPDPLALRGIPVRVRHLGDVPTYAETSALYLDYDAWSDADPTYADVITPGLLWSGVVTKARAAWVNGSLPVVRLTCADPVATAQRQRMASLPVAMTTHVGAAQWCFPLTESDSPMSSATATARVRPLSKVAVGFPLEGNELGYQDFPSPGSNDGEPEAKVPVWVESTATSGWAFDTGNVGTADMPALSSFLSTCTLHAMIAPSPEGLGRARFALSIAGDIGSLISIGVDSLNYPTMEARPGAPGVVYTLTSPVQVRSGEWSHVALRMAGDPTDTVAELWVNGVMAVSATFSALWYTAGSRRIVAGARITPRGELADVWQGALANVSAHQDGLESLVLQRVAAGRGGWTGDDTCGRFNRVLYALGYDRAALPEGSSTMCPQHTRGRSLADALTDCATAERAPWWVDRDGKPTMAPRSARWSASTVTTLPADALGQALEFTQDNAIRQTVAVVSRPGGQTITRRHPAADLVGEVGAELTLLVDSDGQVETLADEMVTDRHAIPQIETESMTVDVVRSGRLLDIGDVLAVDVEDVVEITGLPSSAPWTSRRVLVRHVTDRITPSSWLRTFTVVDAPELIDVFRVGDELDGPRVLGW